MVLHRPFIMFRHMWVVRPYLLWKTTHFINKLLENWFTKKNIYGEVSHLHSYLHRHSNLNTERVCINAYVLYGKNLLGGNCQQITESQNTIFLMVFLIGKPAVFPIIPRAMATYLTLTDSFYNIKKASSSGLNPIELKR